MNRTIKRQVALAVLAGMCFGYGAFSAPTTASLGIYGFVKVYIPPAGGVNLIGFNFISDEPQYLSDVFPDNSLRKDSVSAEADAIYLWDEGAQAYNSFFQKPDGLFYSVEDPDGSAVQMEVKQGAAMFLRSPATAQTTNTICFSGTVSLADTKSVPYTQTVVFANPYPYNANLNSALFDWFGATEGELPTLADQVHIWDPNKAGGPGYRNFFLKNVGGTNLWHDGTSPFAQADPILPVGGGAVYSAIGSFTNVIVRPFDI